MHDSGPMPEYDLYPKLAKVLVVEERGRSRTGGDICILI